MGSIKLVEKLPFPKATLYVREPYLFILGVPENALYDISERLHPRLLSKFGLRRDEGGYVNTLLGFSNKRAYFQIGYLGMEVVDFKNEQVPESMGIINNIELKYGKCDFLGKYLITTTAIYDIYDPGRPFKVGEFGNIEITDFVLIDSHVIAASRNKGVIVFDLSSPSTPSVMSSINIEAHRISKLSQETMVAEASHNDDIYIIDVSQPQQIAVLSTIRWRSPKISRSLICIKKMIMFQSLAQKPGDTLYIFSVENPKRPSQSHSISTSGVICYAAYGNYVLLRAIKDWDGIGPVSKWTQLVRILRIAPDSIETIGEIEFEESFLLGISLLEDSFYLPRLDGIYVYRFSG